MPALPLRPHLNANLLHLQNLLSGQPGISPFTLVLDTLEQPANDLIKKLHENVKANKGEVIYVSFETLRPPTDAPSVFIKGRRKSPDALRAEIAEVVKKCQSSKTLLVIDTLYPLSTLPPPFSLPTYLSSLLTLSPHLSLLAIYHLDIPLPSPPSSSHNPYIPSPLILLRYLATTILTIHSLSHALAKKKARDRSLPEPLFGMEEEVEGVLVGMKEYSDKGIVLEMEHRRKSGRTSGNGGSGAEGGMFYLPSSSTAKPMMLESHPFFRPEEEVDEQDAGEMEGTFELRLTERQKREREGVVLPYFDAQKGEGAGEGGRILYDMGVEDDFDEEEDEI